MSYLDESMAVIRHLKTEEVPATRIAPGDIIIRTDVMLVGGVEAPDPQAIDPEDRPLLTILGVEGAGDHSGIRCRPTDIIRRIDRSCLRRPPISQQWDSFEDKLSAVESMQAQVLSIRERNAGMCWAHEAKELVIQREGFCTRCGLPVGSKHAEHDPKFEVREGDRVTVLRRPRDGHNSDLPGFFKARRKVYIAALESLTKGELMEMPIPFIGLYTACLIDELTDRIAKLPKPRTRYDWLNETSPPVYHDSDEATATPTTQASHDSGLPAQPVVPDVPRQF